MRNLIRHGFCLSVIVGLFQNSLESSLSMFSLPAHLQILTIIGVDEHNKVVKGECWIALMRLEKK